MFFLKKIFLDNNIHVLLSEKRIIEINIKTVQFITFLHISWKGKGKNIPYLFGNSLYYA